MNASAIYSKSGKGVQEASGKTSQLARSDRAVLAAIDGRATLADVAQKVGKSFDAAFEKLIETLDKGGFIREVSPGTAAKAGGAGAKPAASPGKPASAPMDVASDLDFTTALSIPKSARPAPPPQAPPNATPAPPRPSIPIPPAPPPPSADEKAKAERIAREQQAAFVKAREEAERKAQAERDRVKAEAEAKMRAETESKLRAETEARLKAQAEAKVKAEAEAKIKAARDAAAKVAEAKAKAEAEARRAREEAERIRREAEEKAERIRKEAEEKARREAAEAAERARKEAEEKARREQEELRRKLEEERKAREEAERRAREEAARLEEERRKLEEERRAREEEKRLAEQKRREEEERAMRRIQEERERVERKRAEQEAAKRKAKEEEQSLPELKLPEPEPERRPEPAKAAGGGFSDTLLADLESFTTRDEQDQKDREEEVRKEQEAAAARAREADERRAREDAERQQREEKEQRKREAAEQKAREEAELREREEREKERLREEEQRRKAEAEERAKRAKQEESLAAKATRSAAFDAELRAKRERELMGRAPRSAGMRSEKKGWGKPIALTLFLLLLAALGVAHVLPIDTAEYERAATDALGRPVKIGSARLSLFTGLQLKFTDVSLGDGVRIPRVRAFPELDAVLGPRKAFSRIEVEGMKLDPGIVGQALFARVKADNFSVSRVVLKNVEFTGPLALPKGLELDAAYDANGMVRAATLRGPEALAARLTPKGSNVEVDMSAATFTLPFAPEITLGKFSMKGTASQQRLSVTEWDGTLLNGTVSGTANVRWGESWTVEGVVTARNIYAAVFAPALISDGRAEGSGKFLMRGEDPGKLSSTARLDGSFTVTRGVLGSIDLSRAIQTGGKSATGRTTFNELNGQGTYDRGAISLRNMTLGAGQLNAGASADISQSGALSGRIVADVKVASQTLRATLNLGGTVKEPQVRN